ncbi:cytoskeleton organisation protein [Aspergillus luchuensis]|uniref:Cytoskeleton organisation protein n=1 Tax=Aspergillus kawachii TaxID=1069201 RepID=A0A146FA97_ASPKA|nr:cytoskeleton organisation protein [Aspergillus luchuensis]
MLERRRAPIQKAIDARNLIGTTRSSGASVEGPKEGWRLELAGWEGNTADNRGLHERLATNQATPPSARSFARRVARLDQGHRLAAAGVGCL